MDTESGPKRILSPATFYGSGFEVLGKTGSGAGFNMYGMMYRMYIKA